MLKNSEGEHEKILTNEKGEWFDLNFTFPENEPGLVPSIKWRFNYLLFFMQSI